MKWSNHDKLDAYGIRLVGWPENIPIQNPSALKANQNKELLECLKNGSLRFEKLFPVTEDNLASVQVELQPPEVEDDFSWAYDPDAGQNTENDCITPMERPQQFTDSESESSNLQQISGNSPRSHSGALPSRKRQRNLSDNYDAF
jgi:hypothetical protein